MGEQEPNAADLRRQLTDALGIVPTLRSQLDEAQAENRVNDSARAHFISRCDELERQLAEAQTRADAGWKAYRDRTEQERLMEVNAKAAWDKVATLESKLAEAQMERDEAYGYLSRLFVAIAPQCEPLPTLPGLVTQIDNYIAGLRSDLAALTRDMDRLVAENERLDVRATEAEGR